MTTEDSSVSYACYVLESRNKRESGNNSALISGPAVFALASLRNIKIIRMNNEAGCEKSTYLVFVKEPEQCQASKHYMSLKYIYNFYFGLVISVPLHLLTLQKTNKLLFWGKAASK